MDAYDLPALFGFREAFSALTDGPPVASIRPPPPAGRLAILPGSFNPVTSAHLLLAERALGNGFDATVLLLPAAPAGKTPSGLCAEDRLLTLCAVAPARTGVAVTSAALYCDQASVLADAFPGAKIAFLAGSDKIEQIFDASWYADRDQALDRLFAAARVVAAPRGEGAERIRRLLDQPANRRFASGVDIMQLHPAVGDLSSTRVRGLLASGADPSGLVPPAVADFCEQVRAFQGPDPDSGTDAYRVRVRVIDLLWDAGASAGQVDLRALVAAALGPGSEAAAIREDLVRGRAGAEHLARLHALAG